MGVQKQPISTLDDLIRVVMAVFSAAKDGTPIMVGEAYKSDFGAGSPPRVLFVPEKRPGMLGGAPKVNANYLAGWSHGCTVYVRGAESGEDVGRLDAAYELADRVINAVKGASPGRVVLAPGNPDDDSPLPQDAYGADLTFSFSFVRGVAVDPEITRALRTLGSVSPPDPDRPQGDTGNTFIVETAASVTRP